MSLLTLGLYIYCTCSRLFSCTFYVSFKYRCGRSNKFKRTGEGIHVLGYLLFCFVKTHPNPPSIGWTNNLMQVLQSSTTSRPINLLREPISLCLPYSSTTCLPAYIHCILVYSSDFWLYAFDTAFNVIWKSIKRSITLTGDLLPIVVRRSGLILIGWKDLGRKVITY